MVEILSPSTRAKDLILKKALYAGAGVPSYWVLDPGEPSLLAWELRAGEYVEVARATGAGSARLHLPYPVEIVPEQLVR